MILLQLLVQQAALNSQRCSCSCHTLVAAQRLLQQHLLETVHLLLQWQMLYILHDPLFFLIDSDNLRQIIQCDQ